MGVVGCGALGGVLGGGSYGYSVTQAAKLQRLYDAHRLYQIHYSHVSNETEQSDYAQAFLNDLGVDKQKEKAALKEMSALMELGALCEGERTLSYDEVVDLMKVRLVNIN
jgi:hypothetical protein